MTEQVKRLIEFALSKVGCGYIYGATGWVCTAARRQQQAAQYPEYADKILGEGKKWDGRECYDCAQLTKHAVAAGGGYLPSGANTQFNKSPASWTGRGPISTMPDEPCIVYRLDAKNTAQHTGVYVGNGDVVDASGTADGVIKSKLSSYPWTHWAKPLLGVTGVVSWEEQRYPCDAIVRTKTGGGIGLWGTASTNGTKIKAVPEGGVVTMLGKPAASGFTSASYGGSTGYCDTQYLFPVSAGEPEGDVLEPIIRPDGSDIGSNLFEANSLRVTAYPAIGNIEIQTPTGIVVANDGDYIVDFLGYSFALHPDVFRAHFSWVSPSGELKEI